MNYNCVLKEKTEYEYIADGTDKMIAPSFLRSFREGKKLITLIESAKATSMIGSEAWQDGEGIYQETLDFIRATLLWMARSTLPTNNSCDQHKTGQRRRSNRSDI